LQTPRFIRPLLTAGAAVQGVTHQLRQPEIGKSRPSPGDPAFRPLDKGGCALVKAK